MELKPYIVIHKPTGHRALAEAKSKNSARRIVAGQHYEVRTPTMSEILELGAQNIKPLTDGDEGEGDPNPDDDSSHDDE